MTCLKDDPDNPVAKIIRETLRIPDCGHKHVSWPNADVEAIIHALERKHYVIVEQDEIDGG